VLHCFGLESGDLYDADFMLDTTHPRFYQDDATMQSANDFSLQNASIEY
jgi:hypothetical protein